MTYVLGIDGGGTKTTGTVVHESGKIIARSTVGACNPNTIAYCDIRKSLLNLLLNLQHQANDIWSEITYAFAGISGAGNSAEQQKLKELLTELLPNQMIISVDHDAVIALYSGTLGAPGIVQICGTGSITYGINERSSFARVGGWGHLIGESGSGYALGSKALQAAFLAYDNIAPPNDLSEIILHHFQVRTLPDIIPIIYQAKNPKEVVASVSKLLFQAADNGDKTAINMLYESGTDIGASIAALIKHLFNHQLVSDVPVVLAGGIFNRLDLFKESIKAYLNQMNIPYTLVKPKLDPVGGAAVAAFIEANIAINHQFSDVYVQSYKSR
ncbi:N-acetylglucosamine kinase [Lentibacillus saliphilus]|uniref:N-acetylglucosamine kinase n=1 Tax=Lentibacillus saliphilus TaxID=2737028 RepID=UPI001C30ABCF|nr:BadF/BadG/BcrA/BcrD ATPase family protein [Lentibacillus saliphilus]